MQAVFAEAAVVGALRSERRRSLKAAFSTRSGSEDAVRVRFSVQRLSCSAAWTRPEDGQRRLQASADPESLATASQAGHAEAAGGATGHFLRRTADRKQPAEEN